MSLKEEERRVLVILELEKVDKTLAEMEVQLSNSLWGMAANRLYYAVFHVLNALLVSDNKPACSHKGMRLTFGKNYVLTGLASEEEAYLLSRMETMRNKADYNCTFTAKAEVVTELYPLVKDFIGHLKQLINRERCD